MNAGGHAESYDRAVTRMFDLQRFGMKFGLKNINRLLSALDNPAPAKRTVIVGGTNGKGSIAAMLASIAQQHGYRVGLFTSPHLVSFTERIQINGERISRAEVVEIADYLWEVLEPYRQPDQAEPVTFFEILTAMAVLHFSRRSLDLAVFEVGLGGRLDATNALPRHAVVLSDIGFEHQQYLGEGLDQIVWEKASLMRQGLPVIAAGGLPGAAERIAQFAKEIEAPLMLLDRDFSCRVGEDGITFENQDRSIRNVPLRLHGAHQLRNVAMAIQTALCLGYERVQAIRQGVSATRWPGRLEMINDGSDWLLDCAHNPAAAQALAEALPDDRPIVWLAAVMEDKDIQGILRALIEKVSTVVCTQINMPRGCPAEDLASLVEQYGKPAVAVADLTAAMQKARELAGADHLILAAGSIFLVGYVRGQLTGERGP